MPTVPTFIRSVFVIARHRRVWKALVDPAATERHYHGLRLRAGYHVGEPWDYLREEQLLIRGRLLAMKPGRMIFHTFRFESAEELDSRVRIELVDCGALMTEVRLTHRFKSESGTWYSIPNWWDVALGGLRHFVEAGRAVPVTAR